MDTSSLPSLSDALRPPPSAPPAQEGGGGRGRQPAGGTPPPAAAPPRERLESGECALLFRANPGNAASIGTYSKFAVEYDRYFDDASMVHLFGIEMQCVERAVRPSLLAARTPNLLEVGIGTGRFALHMLRTCPDVRVFGIEPAEGMARMCRRAFNQSCVQVRLHGCPAEELDEATFGGARMGCVLMVTTLGLLQDHGLALQNIRRVLAPHGRVVVAFINGETAWGRAYDAFTRSNKFYQHGTCVVGASDVAALFARHGYVPVAGAAWQAFRGSGAFSLDKLLLRARAERGPTPGCGEGLWSVLTFEAAR